MTDHAELANLTEQELKNNIKTEWRKHEELAKHDLAPLLYYLRDKLRAQGARNDIADKDRGFAAWVEEHLDISRRTADRWCEWFAVEAGLLDKCPEVDSEDLEFCLDILNQHKGQQQIAFNYWVAKALHAKYTKALAALQKKFGVKNAKEAVVRGVIYAASAINRRGKTKPIQAVARVKSAAGHKQVVHGSRGHRRVSGSKAMRAVAGR